MEAIQKLPLRESSVEVRDGAVFIDGLLVRDRTLADLIERRLDVDLDADDTVRDALEIGARVLDREATRAEVDFVKHEFERVSTEVERAFADRAEETSKQLQEQFEHFLGEDGGALAEVLDAHADETAELIAQHFGADRNTAVQHQVRELVSKLLAESRLELIRQFSAEDGHNPLSDFKAAILRELKGSAEGNTKLLEKVTQLEGEVKRLHDAQDAEADLAAERERGTGKGREFEQHTFELVERMAAARGDVAHHVGDERSAAGGKKGDIVIELEAASGPAKGRIAIDAKDEKLSKNKAWTELNAALTERDARFAILVVASEEKVPSGREPLHEYEGNKMIVPLDKETFDARALELAYRYARCRCLMTSERELQIDAPGVRDAAEEALAALRDAQKIRASLTGASKGVEGAREALDTMVLKVEASLDRIESLIEAPKQAAQAA